MAERLYVISGIPPGPSGTGMMLSHLERHARQKAWERVQFFYPKRLSRPPRLLLRERRWRQFVDEIAAYYLAKVVFRLRLFWVTRCADGASLVIHPQTIGFRRTLRHMESWKGRTFLYPVDVSFFCIRSYNYIDGETKPCLRCLGGRFEESEKMGCRPFPIPDEAAGEYVRRLMGLVSSGRVRLLALNAAQAELLRRHFGGNVEVPVVGLWAADWTACFGSPPKVAPTRAKDPTEPGHESQSWDVVFHAYYVPAKGAKWLLSVARLCPEVQFLFPFPKALEIVDAPSNVTFKPMTWESGLDRAVQEAALVCVPSLWSAPAEGALIKSLAVARAVAVVRNDTALASELPDGLVLKLSPDPAAAARELADAVTRGWAPDPGVRARWLEEFRTRNSAFFDNILAEIDRDAG